VWLDLETAVGDLFLDHGGTIVQDGGGYAGTIVLEWIGKIDGWGLEDL
jgi:hypothetical protein